MKYISYLIAIIISVFGSVETMVVSRTIPEQNDEKSFRKPLAEWQKVHPFSSQDEMDYYKKLTWNPQLTLEKNQKKLVKKFVDECCDFSFKIKSTGLREIYLGELDSGESLVFFGTSTTVYSDQDYEKIIIYNNDHREDGGLILSSNTASFFDYRPIKSGETFKAEFLKYFFKLAEDSIGCKLFRIFLAKSVVNKFSKIAFIPVESIREDTLGEIGCFSGQDICYYLADYGNAGAIRYLQQDLRHRFILFSPKFFSKNITLSVIKYVSNDILFEQSRLLQESALLHELIHSLHSKVDQKLSMVKNIKKRSRPYHFGYISDQRQRLFHLRCDQMNINLFHNDEEYHTMYGLASEGLDLLNESSYLAHRYGFIRLAHEDTQRSEVIIDEMKLSKGQSIDFIQNFFRSYGDYDLFHYYLSPDSPIKFPKFGVGQYRCADLDPETGEKIS